MTLLYGFLMTAALAIVFSYSLIRISDWWWDRKAKAHSEWMAYDARMERIRQNDDLDRR